MVGNESPPVLGCSAAEAEPVSFEKFFACVEVLDGGVVDAHFDVSVAARQSHLGQRVPLALDDRIGFSCFCSEVRRVAMGGDNVKVQMWSTHTDVEQPSLRLGQRLEGVAEDLEQGPRRVDQRVVPLGDVEHDDGVCLLAFGAVSRAEADLGWFVDVEDVSEVAAILGELGERTRTAVEVDDPSAAPLAR